MIEIIFTILFSIALFAVNYTVNADIFYPPALFNLIWTVIYIFYALFIIGRTEESYFLNWQTLLIFISGQVLFSLGSLFAVKRDKSKATNEIRLPEVLYSFDKIIFVILLVLFPLYLYKIIALVNNSGISGEFITVVRYEFAVEQVDIGVIKYANSLAFFGFAIAVYKFNFTKGVPLTVWQKLYKYSYYLIAVSYSLLSAGRTYIMFIFCIYLGSRIVKGNIRLRNYLVMLGIILFVFVVFSVILKKGGDSDLSFAENIGSVYNSFVSYLLGGAYGFNLVVTQGFQPDYGQNVFRFFIAIGNALGITSIEPKELVMPFYTNPIVGNIYSVYYPYIKDFRYIGLIFFCIWGYVHTFFYYRAGKNFTCLFIYSILLYPLLMSFFQDQYVSLFSTWVQMLILVLIAQPFIQNKKLSASPADEALVFK